MRTTLTIDDDLAQKLKQRAQESDRPFKVVVNEVLRAGLEETTAKPSRRPYRNRTVSMGPARAGIDLDKALALSSALEDEELARKIEQRK